MATSYVTWRLQTSPSWMLGPVGQALSTALGTAENALYQAATWGVEERFPDYAGLDSAGVSSALAYILNDRSLFAVYPDDSNLDATRLYAKSGFSVGIGIGQLASGCTLSWFPATSYVAGVQIGQGGFVWRCTTAGTSSAVNPFPSDGLVSSQLLGTFVTDGTVTWTLQTQSGAPLLINSVPSAISPTNLVVGPPPVSGTSQYRYVANAPGFYWAGTDVGFIAALVSAGFFDHDGNGNLVTPRIYTNRDWTTVTSSNALTGFYGGTSEALILKVVADGVVGAGGSIVAVTELFGTDAWVAHTTYPIGTFVHDPAHTGHVYWAVASGSINFQGVQSPGESGASNPFPASPTDTVWPPTTGAQAIVDGTVTWLYATFSPIPQTVLFGGSWGFSFSGTYTGTTDSVLAVPNPPDEQPSWSRLWVVVPMATLTSPPLLWGNGTGGFNGYWGGNANGGATPATPPVPVWGGGGQNSNVSLANLLKTISRIWTAAHAGVIGFWAASHAAVVADPSLTVSFPSTGLWNESFSPTIGGTTPPFFRTDSDKLS